MLHGRRKHIETRFHFIREQVNKDVLKVIHCPKEEQPADFLTKVVKVDRFVKLRSMIKMVKFDNLN